MDNIIEVIETAIKEELGQSEQWERHYNTDPSGEMDVAYWKGKAQGERQILHYVLSLKPAKSGEVADHE